MLSRHEINNSIPYRKFCKELPINGRYALSDIENRLAEAISAYDELPADTQEELAPAA